jgi:hypothetical protein
LSVRPPLETGARILELNLVGIKAMLDVVRKKDPGWLVGQVGKYPQQV